MKFGSFRNTAVAAITLVASLGISTSSVANDDILPIDNYVKTIFDKSDISGSIVKNGDYIAIFDTEGNPYLDNPFNPDGSPKAGVMLHFDYTGSVHSIGTDKATGELKELEKEIGTIAGQAAFPLDFAMMAIGMKAYLLTCDPDGKNCTGTLPNIPAAMDWTCNTCVMTVGDNTYGSIVDAAPHPSMIEPMRMEGRAFTGLGPVEIGQILNGVNDEGNPQLSMSVRMAGCSAVVGTAGPDGPQFDGDTMVKAPKMGTLCLNGTFTFDLGGVVIDPTNPMASFTSTITGTGSSNCITVLHDPMPM